MSSNKYYETCPFPKPKTSKAKKLENGYKNKPQRRCWYCDKLNAERHEIFNGPNRQTSIEMGFQVDVCPEHHRALHASGSKWADIEMLKWRRYYQTKYEEKFIAAGITPEHAREMWMQLIGRNYL